MLTRMYVIKDTKAGVFNTPFFQHTHGTAERAFQDLINDSQSSVNKHPEDYDLYYLGTYDDLSGSVVGEAPQHIVSAAQLMRQA